MRVLLVSTNQIRPARGVPWLPVAPLGLAYVASALRAAGHEIEMVDLCFADDLEGTLVDTVARLRPEVIGVSFRNLELMAYFNNVSFLEELGRIVSLCREHSGCRIVIGGSGFSVMPEEILRFTGADFGIVGEGEWSFPEALVRIKGGQSPGDVPGVATIAGGLFHLVPPDRSRALGGRALPARDLIDGYRYREAGGSANLQTKRGCPFKCIYCTYPVIEGAAVRLRPAREVAEEFRSLHDRGLDRAYIVDSQFNHPIEHAKEICEELVAMRDEVRVQWSCMLNPGSFDEELALMLRLARCVRVDLSIESASDSMLERLGKGFTTADVSRTVRLLEKCRLPFDAWILLGGPGETAETIRETLERLVDLQVEDVVFGIGLRICPGTPLERIAREEGCIESGQSLLEPQFYLSMDVGEIVELVLPCCRERRGWRIAAYSGA